MSLENQVPYIAQLGSQQNDALIWPQTLLKKQRLLTSKPIPQRPIFWAFPKATKYHYHALVQLVDYLMNENGAIFFKCSKYTREIKLLKGGADLTIK